MQDTSEWRGQCESMVMNVSRKGKIKKIGIRCGALWVWVTQWDRRPSLQVQCTQHLECVEAKVWQGEWHQQSVWAMQEMQFPWGRMIIVEGHNCPRTDWKWQVPFHPMTEAEDQPVLEMACALWMWTFQILGLSLCPKQSRICDYGVQMWQLHFPHPPHLWANNVWQWVSGARYRYPATSLWVFWHHRRGVVGGAGAMQK